MKYRLYIESYVVIEADGKPEAKREYLARSEEIEKSQTIEEDLLLNSNIISITEEID